MNKKGFTLVELLAVIIILALLAVVANSSITNVVKKSKSDLYDTQIELIKSAAETWGLDNIDKLPNEGTCSYLTLKDLKTYGLFDEEVINPKTNKEFSKDLKIKITTKINKQGVLKPVYEVDAKNISSCDEVYPPICTLVKDSDNNNKITPGDEYLCTVKENTNYTFYVLSENDNGTHNLIMNSNINSLGEAITSDDIADKGSVAWISNEDYGCVGTDCATNDKGPVTALQYLHNITKDWTNIPNMHMDYSDENIDDNTGKKGTTGYGKIKTTGNETVITDGFGATTLIIKDLKSRLPNYKELSRNGCKRYNESNSTQSCPLWLVNYLDHQFHISETYPNGYYTNVEGKYSVTGVTSYWTLSSSSYYLNVAWDVDYFGRMGDVDGDNDLVYHYDLGVRPVITLTLD